MNTFLDAKVADEAKQKAMAQAYAAAPELWKKDADVAVFIVACIFPEFTSDEIWRLLYKPPEPRALGPVLRASAVGGHISKTERRRPTAQVSRHKTDVTIWKSHITTVPDAWKPTIAHWKQALGL